MSRVIQITNISLHASKEQLRTMFGFVGRIEDCQLFPDSETLSLTVAAKVGYVKFEKTAQAEFSLHLSNAVLIDKPIIITTVFDGRIPDETDALIYCAPLQQGVVLIPCGPSWPHKVIHQVVGIGPTAIVTTIDPALSERSLPPYPTLPGSMDQKKVEETRRTVQVGNLDPNLPLETLSSFLSQIGDVAYIRRAINNANEDSEGFAYVEFTEQRSIAKAMSLNGHEFFGREFRVNHSTVCVEKPKEGSNNMTSNRSKSPVSEPKRRSRSRGRKSKSPVVVDKTKRRSRSRGKGSSNDRSRPPRSRSRSKRRSRSPRRSREVKRSHSRKSKTPPPKRPTSKRSRSRSKKRSKKSRSRSRSRKRSRSPKNSSNSKKKDKKHRHRSRSRSKNNDVKVKRDYDQEEKDMAQPHDSGKKDRKERERSDDSMDITQ